MSEPTGASQIERLEILEVSLFATNCYILTVRGGGTAIVDPGGNGDRILSMVEEVGGRLEYILCTHGHIDHIEAAGQVQARAGGRIVLHRDDLPLWERAELQAQMFGVPPPPPLPEPDLLLDAEDPLMLGAVRIDVRHVPGHAPGHVMYLLSGEGICFNGDTVFAAGVGRTDLWGGDGTQLRASVQEKIFTLPDDTVLYAGHGPSATVSEARRNKPLLDLV